MRCQQKKRFVFREVECPLAEFAELDPGLLGNVSVRQGFAAMNHVVDEHLAQIVTNSYGFDTELLAPGFIKPMEDTLIQAAAEGIGVYFSSGDAGNLAPGDKFEHKFDKAGTFKYVCTVHPGMEGEVVVK